MLRQLLLLPFLAPLVAVLLVGAINPRPAIQLRLLIWSSPALPLGVWIMLAAGSGGLLSAVGTGLALRTSRPALQRQVRRPARSGTTAEPWESPAETAEPAAAPWAAGPNRPAGEPSPTVEVPYRVIRRGRPVGRAEATTATPPSGADGWDEPPSDDW